MVVIMALKNNISQVMVKNLLLGKDWPRLELILLSSNRQGIQTTTTIVIMLLRLQVVIRQGIVMLQTKMLLIQKQVMA